MRRMLDPKEVGGASLPSTITFDEEGNRTVGKNLGVDGKLKLKSLVSNTNPDGDITKELGGGELHGYAVILQASCYYIVFTTKNYDWDIGVWNPISNFSLSKYDELRKAGTYPASGYVVDPETPTKKRFVSLIQIGAYYSFRGYVPETQSVEDKRIYPNTFGTVKLF